VLAASLLEEPAALRVVFGEGADTTAADLAALGVGRRGGTVVRDVLRERLRRDERPECGVGPSPWRAGPAGRPRLCRRAGVILLGLALAVPYWRLLGLL
jgi:hypothetical protein